MTCLRLLRGLLEGKPKLEKLKKEKKMALLKSSINYSGQDLNLIVKKMYSDSYFSTKWGALVKQAVKSKAVWHDLTSDISLEAYAACPASGTGNATLKQHSKALCEFMLTAEFQNNVLLQTYLESEYAQGSGSDKIDQTELFAQILELFRKNAMKDWNNIILNGDTLSVDPVLSLCDGLLKAWNADATVIDVTSVPGNITKAAVMGEIEKVVNAFPKELMFPEEGRPVKIGVSFKIANFYREALYGDGNMGYGVFNPTVMPVLTYGDYEIVPLYHMPDNEMFATFADNIMLFYDDDADFSTIAVTDLSLSNALCDKTVCKMTAKGAVDYGFGSEIVYYH